MKQIIDTMDQHKKSKLSHNLTGDKKYIILETEIAKKFNEFFKEMDLSLARIIPNPSSTFEFFF